MAKFTESKVEKYRFQGILRIGNKTTKLNNQIQKSEFIRDVEHITNF